MILFLSRDPNLHILDIWMCLQWNHFSDNVLALPLQLENLKEGLDFTDVTLACQITQFEPILADGVADRTATI